MAITLVTATSGSAANSDPITIAWPSVQQYDCAVLLWSCNTGGVPSSVSGFTLDQGYDADSGSHRSRLYHKVCTGSESGNITLTNNVSNRQTAVLAIYRGTHHSSPIDTWQVRDESSSGTTHANPEVTTGATPDCVIVTCIGERSSSGTSGWTSPSGYTERADIAVVGTGGTCTAIADDGLVTSRAAGTAVTPPVWTSTNSFSSQNDVTWSISLQPHVTTVSPSGIATAQAFGTATVTPGTATVSPTGIASAEAFGTAVITPGTATVSPSGVASGEAFGTTTVTPGAVTVAPSGISSAEAFGTAQLDASAPPGIQPTGITSGEAFGTATIQPGGTSVGPTGIAPGEAFGTAEIQPGGITVSPSGIDSAEAFGAAVVTPGTATVSPSAVSSAETFGTATVQPGGVEVTPEGVASSESFGTAAIVPGGTSVSPVGIASAEAFGLTTVGLRKRAVFRPPVVEEGNSGAGRLFNRVKTRRALTVLKNPNGSYSTVRYPPLVTIENSLAAYLGGHEYELDGPTVVELTAAGYGDHISLE